MKKTILSLVALIGISFMMEAQTKTVTPVKPAKVATGKMSRVAKTTDKKSNAAQVGVKKETTIPAAKTNEVPQKKTATSVKPVTAGPVKKDGTTDMRFKANKEKVTGPMKKDGTPDKRYKANKP